MRPVRGEDVATKTAPVPVKVRCDFKEFCDFSEKRLVDLVWNLELRDFHNRFLVSTAPHQEEGDEDFVGFYPAFSTVLRGFELDGD